MKKNVSEMNRDEVRAEIGLLILMSTDEPVNLSMYSDFFLAPTSTPQGRANNFAIWTRGCNPELVGKLAALRARLDELDAQSAAAAALGRMGGRIGGKSTSEAKRAAARENGAKGGRPTTEFHVGKVFRSEGGWRVCGGVWAGGPIIDQSPWFKTREEAEREAEEMHRGGARLS